MPPRSWKVKISHTISHKNSYNENATQYIADNLLYELDPLPKRDISVN